MDFWKPYSREALSDAFGTAELKMNTGERHNYSAKMFEGRSLWLEVGDSVMKSFDPAIRYLAVKDMTFDLLLTLYDVNTGAIAAVRSPYGISKGTLAEIMKFVKTLKNPNLELRAIGAQNGSKEVALSVKDLCTATKASLIEVDMFGANTRHIVIDTKTGTSYNLLVENRIYRPGELNNSMKKDEFDKKAVLLGGNSVKLK